MTPAARYRLRMAPPEALVTFARTVRARSAAHATALQLMQKVGLQGVVVSLLRQELDSLVRVLYLSRQPAQGQLRLLEQMERGQRWTRTNESGREEVVSDRTMVEAAASLHGWAKSAYKFGCAFIHLSRLHDYSSRDPLALVSTEERTDILAHLAYYHGLSSGPSSTFDDIIPMLPAVFAKIQSNLEAHVQELERGAAASPNPAT